jgi:hypothetical protein
MKQYGHSVALVLVRGMEDGVRSKPLPGTPPPKLSTQFSVIQTSAFLRCSFIRSSPEDESPPPINILWTCGKHSDHILKRREIWH